MVLKEQQILDLLATAKRAALAAGEYISNYDRSSLEAFIKKGGTSEASQVVTEVDKQAQDIILEVLENSIRTFDLGVLTEELEDNQSRFEKSYFWCIDPLDGTLPFIEGKDGYAVSIALVSRDGKPVIGVIYDPLNKVLYEAIKGQGAKRANKTFRVLNDQDGGVTFVSDRSFMKHPRIEQVLDNLKKGGAGLKQVIQHGGAAMNAMWVVEHTPACYFKFPKKEKGGGSLWDYAASSLIVNEAGGVAKDVFSEDLDLNRSDSTFMNHKGILYASSKTVMANLVLEH